MTTSLNTGSVPETTPAPAGHDAAMAAKFDERQANPAVPSTPEVTPPAPEAAPKVERPAHVPEKFWDAEKGTIRADELAKSYAELEKLKSGKPEDKPAEPAADLKVPETVADAEKLVTDKGLDFNEFSTEFNEKGELSTASYDKLEKAGVPKAMVDAYVAGQVALVNQFRAEVFGDVGGEQKYGELVTWAAANLSKGEQKAYNDAVESRDMARVKLAVAGLNAKFTAVNGSDPQLVTATTTPSAGDVFRSTEELKVAMRDPRYAKDPAYRKDVEQRLSRSSIL